MKVTKKILYHLTKCYSIAPLFYQGKQHFLVAAEKQDSCLLFDMEGNQADTIWEGPGGVMSMVQVPGSNGQFLATQRFYSPNDSAKAGIVIVTPKDGSWEVRTLIKLPFVHRFDILTVEDDLYLLACTLKSAHNYKDDWSSPGKVYAAKLPAGLEQYHEENQLAMTAIKENMLKNHGYCRTSENRIETAVISCEQGVFQFIPPHGNHFSWDIRQFIDEPTSDATMIDLDGDGHNELLTLSAFHGEHIFIYKKIDNIWTKIYNHPKPAEFSHAIWSGTLCGKNAAIVGHRQGARDLLLFYYDPITQSYQYEVIDHDCGSANIACFHSGKNEILVSANRETDEIAMYNIE